MEFKSIDGDVVALADPLPDGGITQLFWTNSSGLDRFSRVVAVVISLLSSKVCRPRCPRIFSISYSVYSCNLSTASLPMYTAQGLSSPFSASTRLGCLLSILYCGMENTRCLWASYQRQSLSEWLQ